MSDRIYTLDELRAEKPKGEVVFRDTFGDVWSTFCCYGCQTCFYFTDDQMETLGQYYPHFLKPFERIHESP